MKELNRRDFFKVAGACTGICALAPAASASDAAAPAVNDEQVGMLYDATKCVGCKACMSACKRYNSDNGNLECSKARFDPDTIWDAPEDLSGNNRNIIKLYKENSTTWSYVKLSCMHCQKPACVSACPVGALTKDPKTGIVGYNKDYCIGCRYCQIACPFNIPKFQWDRAIPQIVKCNFCKDTYFKSKGITACADVCPTKAILYGTRGFLLAEARRRLQESPNRYIQKIYGEKEVGGVNHLYISGVPFDKLGLRDLPEDAPPVFSEKIHHTIYKGFIAPIALYSALCYVALRNMKKQKQAQAAHPHSDDGGKT
jgi:Fe-S-cluster-containing dehydrogenase component